MNRVAEYGYYSHVKRASISEAKNRLSALIDRARRGETILIEDRGVPVVKLESVLASAGLARTGRMARLERQGVIRPAAAPAPLDLLDVDGPALPDDATLSAALLDDRDLER